MCLQNSDLLYAESEINDLTHFIHNFEVSIVLPLYDHLDEVKTALAWNQTYLQRNGIEVIVIIQGSKDKDEFLTYIKQYPFINWIVLVYDTTHFERIWLKAFKAGVHHASKKYIFVDYAVRKYNTDIVYYMRKALQDHQHHYAVSVSGAEGLLENEGSIMAKKEDLIRIKGGEENPACRFDFFAAGLKELGVEKLVIPVAQVGLKEGKEASEYGKLHVAYNQSEYPPCNISNTLMKANIPETEFLMAYSYREKLNNKDLLLAYLRRFEDFVLYENHTNQKYRSILLAQSYNEAEYMITFLKNTARYFDAIILLDDGSNDDTFKLAEHPSIALKAKKTRNGFNDLENRNILLEMAAFFNSDWLAFLDLDEKLDVRFADFSFMDDKKVDTVTFKMIHLWNSPKLYNADYPYTDSGIQKRLRMFRNIGFCKILTAKKTLHFHLTPYVSNLKSSNILILHYGNINRSKREARYARYKREDKHGDQKSYDHLLNNTPRLLHVGDIHFNM